MGELFLRKLVLLFVLVWFPKQLKLHGRIQYLSPPRIDPRPTPWNSFIAPTDGSRRRGCKRMSPRSVDCPWLREATVKKLNRGWGFLRLRGAINIVCRKWMVFMLPVVQSCKEEWQILSPSCAPSLYFSRVSGNWRLNWCHDDNKIGKRSNWVGGLEWRGMRKIKFALEF